MSRRQPGQRGVAVLLLTAVAAGAVAADSPKGEEIAARIRAAIHSGESPGTPGVQLRTGPPPGTRNSGTPAWVPAACRPWLPAVRDAAGRSDVDPALLLAVMLRESDCRNVRGDNGRAHGPMQVHDGAHPDYQGGDDAAASIRYGAAHLRALLDRFRVVDAAVAAYNAGAKAVADALRTGRPVDSVTTGGDYATDVIRRWRALAAHRGR